MIIHESGKIDLRKKCDARIFCGFDHFAINECDQFNKRETDIQKRFSIEKY